MDIRDCNDYRTRLQRAKPALCLVCGTGPCRYPSGGLSLDNTDLEGNTIKDQIEAFQRGAYQAGKISAVIATEDIKAGDAVSIKFDEASGNYYARKA